MTPRHSHCLLPREGSQCVSVSSYLRSGRGPDPTRLAQIASRAEEIGFDSVWTTERLLFPLEPSAPYPVADGVIPDVYKTSLEPLDSLTFVAGQTSRIGLGVSVLNLPWYNPALLARRLTTIDVLSRGRLRVGFGIGWSPEEYKAVGSAWNVRGKRFAEALQALKTIWTTDPVEFHGEFFDIPRSVIGPKPVQKPHPPIYLAAYTPPALERVARDSNGWNPVGIPPAGSGPDVRGDKGDRPPGRPGPVRARTRHARQRRGDRRHRSVTTAAPSAARRSRSPLTSRRRGRSGRRNSSSTRRSIRPSGRWTTSSAGWSFSRISRSSARGGNGPEPPMPGLRPPRSPLGRASWGSRAHRGSRTTGSSCAARRTSRSGSGMRSCATSGSSSQCRTIPF